VEPTGWTGRLGTDRGWWLAELWAELLPGPQGEHFQSQRGAGLLEGCQPLEQVDHRRQEEDVERSALQHGGPTRRRPAELLRRCRQEWDDDDKHPEGSAPGREVRVQRPDVQPEAVDG